LIERLNIPPEQVTTTHLAADPIFQQPKGCPEHQKQVLDKYGLGAGEYLFFPGHTWPHKNHRTAFQALRMLREIYHLEPMLVCTGSPKEAHSRPAQSAARVALRATSQIPGLLSDLRYA
jgi:hypothetical protein